MLRIGIGLLVIILSTANVSAAPYLVKDINPFPGVGARPRGLTQMNGALFFEACGDVWYDEEEDHFAPTDCELWKSDGTAEGTNRVKDIFPGSGSSQPLRLTAMNGRLFFRACDPDSGCELWSSDGTEEGTRRVADINPGPADGLPDTDGELSILNGTLLFWACEPVGGCEPWKSDGTEAGTVRIADINPGPGGSRGIYGAYRAWTVLNGQLFFDASEPSGGQELWK